jgi:hypothetical protein
MADSDAVELCPAELRQIMVDRCVELDKVPVDE